jgi:ABC-type transport system substrate-binding protein
MLEVWPELPGARDLIEGVRQKYPRVVVAVSDPMIDATPDRIDDWAARRSGRLVFRSLMEFSGAGSEGGVYQCPVGRMEIAELGRRLEFQLNQGVRWPGGDGMLIGSDVARRLLAMANPKDEAYRASWGEVFDGVAVDDVYHIDVDLLRPHVRPESLLQTVLLRYSVPASEDHPRCCIGAYDVDAKSEDETVFVAKADYFAMGATQPREIAERRFRESDKLLAAMERGRIDVVDRVSPWDVDRLRAMKDVVIEPYALPRVHCLIPNRRRPLTASRTFRRALAYGIHREVVLGELLAGTELTGCRLVSGPFAPGVSDDDPLNYAYDEDVPLRTYQPRLAVALARVALDEVFATAKKEGAQTTAVPRLVLAHPADAIARKACEEIQRHLGLIGVPVDLQERHPGAAARIPDDVDLMYVELAIWEPVVDAHTVLGHDGISGGASPHMSLALRQLTEAEEWRDVRASLRQVHRLAHDEVAVVPLWQMTDCLAYRRGLKGVGSRPISLYQNVEQWQPDLRWPAEPK